MRRRLNGLLGRTRRLLAFAGFFVWELLAANVALVWDILTPGSRVVPGVVRFELRCRSRFEIALLAELLSLTPGTLVLEVRREPPVLFVHGMYEPDRDAFVGRLRALEGRMLAAVRRRGEADRLEGVGDASG